MEVKIPLPCGSGAEDGGSRDTSEKGGKTKEMVRFYLLPSPLIPNINFIATGLLVKEEQEKAAFMF